MSRLNVANFRHPDGTADNINITSGGDVGIGTSSPNDNYGTNLAVHDSGTTGARLKLSTSGTGEGNLDGFDLITTGNNAFVTNRESGTLALATNNTTAAEIASGGEFRFNSGYGSVATAYGVRAWCNANTMSANTFNGSGNVSSITDNGSGDYTVNFTTSMPDTGYSVVAMGFEVGSTGTSDGYFTVERATNYSDSMATGSVTVKTNSGGDRNLNLIVVR